MLKSQFMAFLTVLSPLRFLWIGVLVGCAWFFSARLGMSYFSVYPKNIAMLWLPSGVGILGVMLGGRRTLPFIALASFLANYEGIVTEAPFTASFPLFSLLISTLIDTSQATIGAHAFQRFLPKGLYSAQGLFILSLLTGILTFSSALLLWGNLSLGHYSVPFSLVFYLTISDTLGIFIVLPPFLMARYLKSYTSLAEFSIVISLALFILSLNGLGLYSSYHSIFLFYLSFVVLMILTAQLGGWAVILIQIALTFQTFMATVQGYGPFVTHDYRDLAMFAFSFMASSYLVLLQHLTLSHAKKTLEQRVEERSKALQSSEHRYRLLAEHTLDVIWVLNLKTERLSYISPAVEKMRGYSVEEVMEQPLEALFSSESLESIRESLKRFRENQALLKTHWELEQPCQNGKTVWTDVLINVITTSEGEPVELLGVSRDITEKRQLMHRLEEMAHFDSLTGLPNRTLLRQKLERIHETARLTNQPFALMFIDLDGFKQVNDVYGHATGDALLKETGHRIAFCLRESDCVGRLSGDEFVVILSRIHHEEEALRVRARIIETLALPMLVNGHQCRIGASIGLALYPKDATESEHLLSIADTRMYEEKQTHKKPR